MKTSVIIPNWNGLNLLKKNLPDVLDIGADEVIIVDDASTDGSQDEIKRMFKISKKRKLQLIENEKNIGFARSVNRGIERASGDIIILLNSDVKPLPGLIKAISSHFDDGSVFAVSFSEKNFSWAKGKWKNGFVEHEPGGRSEKTHPTFWASGGSSAFRRSIWNELGGFSYIYEPFYWEDIDISYRAAKRGYKVLWEPNAKVIHEHESTIGKYFSRNFINFIQERNQLLFIWKNITSKKLTREHQINLVRRVLKHPGYIKIITSALSKFKRVRVLSRQEKRESKLTDQDIFEQFK